MIILDEISKWKIHHFMHLNCGIKNGVLSLYSKYSSPKLSANPNATPQPGNNSVSQATSVATHQLGSDAGNSQGGPLWQLPSTQATSWWQFLDWRVLDLIAGGLTIAITLIFFGYTSLKRSPRGKDEQPLYLQIP